MQVAHITPSMSFKGAGVSLALRELARHQADLGLEVALMSLKDRDAEHDAVRHEKIACHTGALLGPRALGYSAELKRLLFDNHTANIVHCHGLWMYPSLLARQFAARRDIPLVISPHGMLDSWAMKNSTWKKKIAGWLYENRNLRSAACIHALCESEYQSIRAYGLTNPVAIIPNGIDLPDPTAKQKAPPCTSKIGDDRKVILFLGRIHPKKGIDNLIRAWSILARTDAQLIESWRLVIAGWSQGGHEEELKQLVRELGLTDNISFVGPLHNEAKDAAFRSAKAFILPSFSEGLPMAVLEAWSYRLPVIMTRECNIPEGFEKAAAIEVRPDIESITKGLAKFAGLPQDDRSQLGRNGFDLANSRFTWSRIAADMIELYRWLLNQGPQPRFVRLN